MFARLWAHMKGWLVQEVPDEIAACLDCEAKQCLEGRYRTCPNRLKMSEGLKAIRLAETRSSWAR